MEYDLDGNMKHLAIDGEVKCFEYDSANRLIKATGHTYTYNAEDIRIRNLCCDEDTVYTYNTNCKLSQLLVKTTNGVVTKYVYGLGLIGEEKSGEFKTYHFDYRGSTIAVTDTSGNVTDTFEYNAYGKIVSRTGNSDIIFCYNGRDGVVTEKNGLIYMRARYYSPDIRRFVNADIIRGAISDSTSLNRYAYVNGNPASLVDPLGLSAERGTSGNSFQDVIGRIGDWFNNTFGFAITVGSDYEVLSIYNFLGDIETGFSLGKGYSGDYKPIEFIYEIDAHGDRTNDKVGIKVNFDDERGFKFSYNLKGTSLEVANKDKYYEFISEANKIGFTKSSEVDWKNYSVGSYTSYYIRPNNIKLVVGAVAAVAAIVYSTGGAAAAGALALV